MVEVIEETALPDGVKELLLTLAWRRPLHVVVLLLDAMLASDVEIATRHFEATTAA